MTEGYGLSPGHRDGLLIENLPPMPILPHDRFRHGVKELPAPLVDFLAVHCDGRRGINAEADAIPLQ